MRKSFLALVLLLGIFSINSVPLAASPRGTRQAAGILPIVRSITSVAPSASRVAAYDRLELTVVIDADFNNPYDPDDIRLDGTFESPSGVQVTVPGFYYRDFTLNGTTAAPTDDWSWRVRFTPTEPGTWRYQVTASAGDTTQTSDWSEFTATASDNPGFIRVDSRNPHYFAFDSGAPYFPIGENMGWADGSPIADYHQWMGELSAAGGSYIRVWMASWGFGIEWKDTGLGNYDLRQDRAFALDQVFNLAHADGIYIMLSLLNHGAWNPTTNPEWVDNPYNVVNGGMLTQPQEFMTNPEAIRLWHQRLHYIAARWGYSPNLMTWEWWNEINWTAMVDPALLTPWIEESAAYLKTLDPYNHLITHSGSPIGSTSVWGDPTISFTQQHLYNLADIQRAYHSEVPDWLAAYPDKPFIMGEFGTDSSGASTTDMEGMGLHIGLWAAPMNGSAGTGMMWWWDTYTHPLGLTTQFTPVARFFGGEDMGARQWNLTDAKGSASAARVYGLQADDYALLWLVNRRYNEAGFQKALEQNLRSRAENPYAVQFDDVADFSVTVPNLAAGEYTVEVWDAQTGDVLSTASASVDGGDLTVVLPTFSRDLAVKVKPAA